VCLLLLLVLILRSTSSILYLNIQLHPSVYLSVRLRSAFHTDAKTRITVVRSVCWAVLVVRPQSTHEASPWNTTRGSQYAGHLSGLLLDNKCECVGWVPTQNKFPPIGELRLTAAWKTVVLKFWRDEDPFTTLWSGKFDGSPKRRSTYLSGKSKTWNTGILPVWYWRVGRTRLQVFRDSGRIVL
jgi:hypothetical protein